MASPTIAPRSDADEHKVETAKQVEIAAAVEQGVAPVEDETSTAPIADEREQVTLRSVNVDEYPLTVTVANAEPLVFEDERATVEVDPEVAEQIAHSPVVEVVE